MALPSGYKRLEYIQVTGTQYIDTGFKPNQNTRVVLDFQASNNTCHLFGARTGFLDKGFLICWLSDFVYCVQVGNGNWSGGVFDEKARHTAELTASEFKLDSTSVATFSAGTFQCEYNLYLASCPNSNESENMQGNLCGGQVYDGSTKYQDFIPCETDTGSIGMWDDVNSVFHGNAGTGTFIAGPVVGEGGSSGGPGESESGSSIPPVGDHNINISNVAREIEGGTVLIGGVVREIESGTVLVGGVAREIAFSQPVSITISGTIKTSIMAYCAVDGVKVGPETDGGSATIEVDKKQVVTVYVSAGTYLGSRCKVTLNRTTVLSGAGTYTLDITQYTTVTIKFTSQYGLVTGGSELVWSAAITAS